MKDLYISDDVSLKISCLIVGHPRPWIRGAADVS